MATMDDEIGRLEGLSAFELRALWRRHWKQPPPMRLSKDMLVRGLAWKLQEQTFGGIGKLELRKLAALAKAAGEQRLAGSGDHIGDAATMGLGSSNNKAPAASNSSTSITLREGNRLVRDWNGTTHTVLVLESGFEWRGQQFGSLSKIAEAITGAHWSGPRFFGLVKRKPDHKADYNSDRKVTAIGSNTVVGSNSEQQPACKTTEAAGRVQ
jgi:hypothetical protein